MPLLPLLELPAPPPKQHEQRQDSITAVAVATAAATAAAILLESGSFSIGGLKLQNGRFTVVMLDSFLSKLSVGLSGPG